MKQVPEKLSAFTAYRNGNEFLGVTDVTLPNFESLTTTVSGAGIAGEIESPTIGMFGSLGLTLNWRTIEKSAARLIAPVSHALDFRGNQQVQDTVNGGYKQVPIKVTVRATPKGFNLGKLEQNSSTESANEFEITYIKVTIEGRTMIELDKLNYVFVVDGVDYMADVRKNLGL